VNRKFRLTKKNDIERVRRSGKSYAHPLIVLIAQPNLFDHSRFCIAAGRSIGGAVQRNRAKRRIRAALAPLLKRINSGWDILILARKPISQAAFSELESGLNILLKKANLLQ